MKSLLLWSDRPNGWARLGARGPPHQGKRYCPGDGEAADKRRDAVVEIVADKPGQQKDELNKIGIFKVEVNFHTEVKANISIRIDKIQSK